MTQSLEDILFSLQERDEQSVTALTPSATEQCPSLPHFRESLLDPTRWTDDERNHLFTERCAPCQKTLQRLRQSIWHPERLDLLRVAFGRPAHEARYVSLHLERDNCLRCNKLVAFMQRAPFLAPLVDLLDGNGVDRVKAALASLLAPREPVLLPLSTDVQGWDTTTRPELFEQFSLGAGEITVTMQEDRGAQPGQSLLLLTVETRQQRFANRLLSYAIMGANLGQERVGGVEMGAVGLEGWISGTVVVGPLAEVQAQVGDDVVLMVYDPNLA